MSFVLRCGRSLSSRAFSSSVRRVLYQHKPCSAHRYLYHNRTATVSFCSNGDGAGSGRAVTHLTEDQAMIRQMARQFAEEQIGPKVMQMDEQGYFEPEIVQALFEQGFMGVEIDPKFGGAGMSFFECILIIEELARVDPAIAAMVDIHNTLLNRIVDQWGTDEQKEHYLPIQAKSGVSAFAISEPGSGSDAFALKMKATRDDGKKGYVLSGAKCWISNSKEATHFAVFATVDPSKGYKGITCFLVDKESPGLEVGKKEDKLGIRASSTCTLHLEDVFVPDNRILGPVGQGYKVAIQSLNEGRIGIAAQMLGLAKGAFDKGVRYAAERQQFGKATTDFQGMRFQIAQARTEIAALEALIYNAAMLKETGQDFAQEAAMCKLLSAQVAERIASQALEWHGGVGFTREYPAEKYYRDAKIGAIYEGTSNIQLETISKMLMDKYNSGSDII